MNDPRSPMPDLDIDGPRARFLAYQDEAQWAHASADALSETLIRELAIRPRARLLLSGGKTPAPVYAALARMPLPWDRIDIALVDERWLQPGDTDSNAWLVRKTLLSQATGAHFEALTREGRSIDDMVAAANLHGRQPADAVVLGMGDDGHTASLFPRSPNLANALNAAAAAGCVGTRSPVAPHPRLSLNLSALLDARRIVLLIAGEAKWSTYLAAEAAGAVEDMPVRAVLRQRRTPVEVMWSP